MEYQAPDISALSAALARDYVIQREIGRGGMGVVYLAHDEMLDRLVAVKVLPPSLAAAPSVRERFLREARTAARLTHPNIVPIHRADEVGGFAFFVMAYVDGESLADRLRTDRVASPAMAASVMRDVALALHSAHEHGVIHRDIKPENVLLERATGRALVTDFGIARLAEAAPLTATGQVLGTVHYMSPEQVAGDAVDGRSDLYSLGVVGFRALSGRLPFDGESASAVLVAHVTRLAPPLASMASSVPAGLARVIDRCLAKDPAARYASGMELAAALDEAMVADAAAAGGDVAPMVLSEVAAMLLWRRAAELQAHTGATAALGAPEPIAAAEAARSLTQGYRMTHVRAAAIEAGIPEEFVARAARELGIERAPAPGIGEAAPRDVRVTPVRHGRRNIWAGAPLRIEFERRVHGELRDRDLGLLLDTIRRTMDEPGHVSGYGGAVTWSSADPQRRLQVALTVRDGWTVIHAQEQFKGLAGGLFGGVGGGVGFGLGSPAVGVIAGAAHSVAAGFAAGAACVLGAYGLARTIFTRIVRGRERKLARLVDGLAEEVGRATAPTSIRGDPAGRGTPTTRLDQGLHAG